MSVQSPGGVEVRLIEAFPKSPEDGDGQSVEIYEHYFPYVRSYRMVVAAGWDSAGTPKPGYEVSTGTGDELLPLLSKLAREISRGMIGFKPSPS